MKSRNSIGIDQRYIILCSIIIILALSLCSVLAAEESIRNRADDRIVFLHFKADSSGISLVDHILADGHLKEPKHLTSSHGLAFRAFTSSGEQFFTEMTENPLIKKYEYEDPNNPGQLIMKIVHLDEAEFWIRIPYNDNLDRIELQLEDNRVDATTFRPDPRLTSTIDLSELAGRSK